MHSLFHMRNLKFLPKFYARILHQGIVLFHMRSTRATKSNNKLGSATWVLGKKSELIWRWGILLHEHHHDITIKTKGTIFPNSVLYWKEPSWENSGFWDLVFFWKDPWSLKSSLSWGEVTSFWLFLDFGAHSQSPPGTVLNVKYHHIFPLYIWVFHCAGKIIFAAVVIISNKLWSSLQHCHRGSFIILVTTTLSFCTVIVTEALYVTKKVC